VDKWTSKLPMQPNFQWKDQSQKYIHKLGAGAHRWPVAYVQVGALGAGAGRSSSRPRCWMASAQHQGEDRGARMGVDRRPSDWVADAWWSLFPSVVGWVRGHSKSKLCFERRGGHFRLHYGPPWSDYWSPGAKNLHCDHKKKDWYIYEKKFSKTAIL
jgi:hypothetical protein